MIAAQAVVAMRSDLGWETSVAIAAAPAPTWES
jgi:hypothetical protein